MTKSTNSRRTVLTGLAALPLGVSLSACETFDPSILDGVIGAGGLTQADAAMGIRAALDNGIGNALSTVGVLNGFLGNDAIRVPLPKVLRDVQSYLEPVGAGGLLNELQVQLNRGAEAAVPVARDIFVGAVRGLTINDALNIISGPATAATDYLRDRTSVSLSSAFSPIMERALDNTGALALVDQVGSQLNGLPFAPNLGRDARTDLVSHGVDYGLRGVFRYIGEEEAAIRANPAKRTSAILRRVFGQA